MDGKCRCAKESGLHPASYECNTISICMCYSTVHYNTVSRAVLCLQLKTLVVAEISFKYTMLNSSQQRLNIARHWGDYCSPVPVGV